MYSGYHNPEIAAHCGSVLRELLRLKEDPDTLRQLERIDLRYQIAAGREALVTLKEQLFFSVDERRHEAHLTERGRTFLSPEDPEAFTMPDLTEAFSQIDGDPNLSPDERQRHKDNLEDAAVRQGERVHLIAQLLKAYCLYAWHFSLSFPVCFKQRIHSL